MVDDSGSELPPRDTSCQAGRHCVASRMGPGKGCSNLGQNHHLQGSEIMMNIHVDCREPSIPVDFPTR
jgi:hypothetical protein